MNPSMEMSFFKLWICFRFVKHYKIINNKGLKLIEIVSECFNCETRVFFFKNNISFGQGFYSISANLFKFGDYLWNTTVQIYVKFERIRLITFWDIWRYVFWARYGFYRCNWFHLRKESSFYHYKPSCQISSKSVKNFLSYECLRHTHRQTDRYTPMKIIPLQKQSFWAR